MEETIHKIISEQLHVENHLITANARLSEDLGADSLDLFQILIAIEEAFDVSVPVEEVKEWPKTVKDLCDRLQQILN